MPSSVSRSEGTGWWRNTEVNENKDTVSMPTAKISNFSHVQDVVLDVCGVVGSKRGILTITRTDSSWEVDGGWRCFVKQAKWV